ncbi:hypothetical protein M409DRAFT_19974 [Zasmidium cellare ATCC 36951]|uniref:Uncharacterized protein n=1 Tax=Zasmidium cellare ATCC 36951 TaxID=1080233 RepID=A0A6A6CS81_ZASCE|nr:uncharacterized protein M409DRAFT_19974 [Zasmidium cellare ATCC 36951]KAF2169563.1 hypothetical protein M409DRAFT_19974 [Zasmidium cellare ATCC 36951]
MGFAFTNKPPIAANTASAFKPLPSLPGTVLRHSHDIQGPAVRAENAGLPKNQPPLVFGIRTTPAPEPDTTRNADALSFFLNSKVPTKRQVWDIKDDFDTCKPRSKFTCYCVSTAECRVTYQPSVAAHTIQQTAFGEPDSSDSPRSFRFIDLPPEMRNRVYSAAISPEHISLRSCATHHMSIGVEPPLATGIFATSKQLAHESKDLMFESTIIVDVSLESSVHSIINPLRLPRNLLAKIKHIVLVLDFTRVHDMNPFRTDWRTVQKMTGLRTMRICAIQMWPPAAFFRPNRTLRDHHRETIKTILECVPKTCAVEYGWSSEAEEEHVREMHRRITLLPSSQ